MTAGYVWVLELSLRYRKLVFGGFTLILLGAVALFPWLGSEFLPRMDDGRVMVKVKLPTGASLTETTNILSRVEEKLQGDPLVESYVTMAGGKVWGLATYEIANEGQVDIQLVPRQARKIGTKAYVERLKKTLAPISIPGAKPMVMQMPVKGIRKLGEADIEVKIKGQELDKLFDLARQTSESMNKLAHFTNVYVSMDMTKPEYQVDSGSGPGRRTGNLGGGCGRHGALPDQRDGGHPLPGRRLFLQHPGDDSRTAFYLQAGGGEPGVERQPGWISAAEGRGSGDPRGGAGGNRPGRSGEGGVRPGRCRRSERGAGPKRTERGRKQNEACRWATKSPMVARPR